MPYQFRTGAILVACVALSAVPAAQDQVPTARLLPASRLTLPAPVDSNVPMAWDLVEGTWRLFGFASFGGVPARVSGPSLDQLSRDNESVEFIPDFGGTWIEAVVADEDGTWYGYYHREVPATICGRPDRFIPHIGALRSTDHGHTWADLGTILEAPPNSQACESSNRYVIGGVGDLSVLLSPDKEWLFIFFSQYSKDRNAQGVGVARLAWGDRDLPDGRVEPWQDGAWIPAREVRGEFDDDPPTWDYPSATPLVPVTRPWHDADMLADAFWGPSVHWNSYLEQYVMLLNRTRNERYDTEGIYVAFAPTLDDPTAWSAPKKIMNGGGWYPQVAGLEAPSGTDKVAGQRARFFLGGKSDQYIEFTK
jgi:hypothetical protein